MRPMAVYKRTYAGYSGPTTPSWPRFLILTRYSFGRLFQSRFLVVFMAVCLFYPIGCAAFIYLSHNSKFLTMLRIPAGQLTQIDTRFFYYYCIVQGSMAYLLTALVGPSLVSPDLVNGAMPLYFCRPFSRFQYVAGKMCVLLLLLSLMTWIPGLLLFTIESSVTGWDWGWEHFWIGGGLVMGLLMWNIVLSLIALATSAWVKWRIAAGAMVLGVFFAGAGFGNAINAVLRTNNGSLIDLTQVAHTIWASLLRFDSGTDMSVTDAWVVVAITCGACVVLLTRKVRAFEVVR